MTETHPETGLPIEPCPGRGQHSAHNWNVYDPTKVKLSRVNPDGDRTCLGYSPFAGITFPDGKATGEPTVRCPSGESPIDWDARLREAVAQTIAARDRRRNERVELRRRRDWGLQQRYAAKEKRVANTGPSDTGTEQPQNDKRGSAQ
jgi:hypothetical protein